MSVLVVPSELQPGTVCLGVDNTVTEAQTFLTPDEALDTASRLITAANLANGITPTGIFT